MLCLLCWQKTQSQPPNLVEVARRAVIAAWPEFDADAEPTVRLAPAVDTTALGCPLISGAPLPTPIDAYRLEFTLADLPLAVHVSADASMTQPCDERFPNLGAGVIALVRAGSDRDGDSLRDSADACPQIAGLIASVRAGCPQPGASDRDGDGAIDARDHCPAQAGAAAASGCALMRDEDGDGVPDHVDICPADPGPALQDFARGCPADGSGSSARLRAADDICQAAGAAMIHADRVEGADVIGALNTAPASVIGRTASMDWYQLTTGWAKSGEVQLSGACYNIPLVNPKPGGATGCYLRPRADYAIVRQAPGGQQVTRLYQHRSFAALGHNIRGDWLFYRAGWARRADLALAGNCDALPLLDPAKVAAGVVHFCAPDYPGLLPPRIDIGERNTRIASHSIANRLRAAPDIQAEQIGEIPPRAVLDAVLDGPACKAPHIWWQVRIGSLTGWTAESDVNANYYYLEPLPPTDGADQRARHLDILTPSTQPQPAAKRAIHSANASALDTIGLLAIEAPRLIAWSPTGDELAIVTDDGAIHRYSYPDLALIDSAPAPKESRRASAIAYNPHGTVLAIGGADGTLTLADLDSDPLYASASTLGEVAAAARGVAWTRAGDMLAIVNGDESQRLARQAGSLALWQFDTIAPADSRRLLYFRFPYPLTAVAFSADSRLLAVTGESVSDQRAGLWVYRVANGELLFSKALVPMRGAARVIVSPDEALGDFVYSSGDSLYQLEVTSGRDQRIYHRAGETLPHFVFRRQVIPDAEALLAVASTAPNGVTRLHIVNALNAHSPATTLDVTPSSIAFSRDGRALAAVEPHVDRVLLLGVIQA
jgi:hypothetical protein